MQGQCDETNIQGGYIVPKEIQPLLEKFLQYPEKFGYKLEGRPFDLSRILKEASWHKADVNQ